jgi:dUTP pyrophosphatase
MVPIKKELPSAIIPKYQTSGAAGFDLHAAEQVLIMPGETVLVDTGLAFELEEGTELQVRPRSGISAKTKARVVLGTVDSDYRGSVKVIIDNIGHLPYTVKVGDRIAQGVIAPIIQASFVEVNELSGTSRGRAGFGSSGA